MTASSTPGSAPVVLRGLSDRGQAFRPISTASRTPSSTAGSKSFTCRRPVRAVARQWIRRRRRPGGSRARRGSATGSSNRLRPPGDLVDRPVAERPPFAERHGPRQHGEEAHVRVHPEPAHQSEGIARLDHRRPDPEEPAPGAVQRTGRAHRSPRPPGSGSRRWNPSASRPASTASRQKIQSAGKLLAVVEHEPGFDRLAELDRFRREAPPGLEAHQARGRAGAPRAPAPRR